MTLSDKQTIRLRLSTEDLCEVLDRIRHINEMLFDVLVEKEKLLVEVRMDDLRDNREREEELIRELIDQEKERLLISEEIGDLLEHDNPVQIRVSEVLPQLSEDLSARLSSRRDSLREVAQRLARQNSLNRALIQHSIDHIQLFMSRIALEGEGPSYDRQGSQPDSNGGSFLMDRRA